MEYIPGIIHESLQMERFLRVSKEFTIVICDEKRLDDFIDPIDWDQTLAIDLKVNDIISIRYYKTRGEQVYCYLEYIISNNQKKEYKKETLISKDFIIRNSFIFEDITIIHSRDDKIDKILNGQEI